MLKAALISPYIDVLGGAEKYLLDIGQNLNQNNYRVELFWPENNIKAKLLERFGNQYDFLKINTRWQQLSGWQKILESYSYDVIFYHSDGSYFLSLAKKNFQLFQVPNKQLIPKISAWGSLKYSRWTPVFNSHFTKRYYLKHTLPKKYYVLCPMISEAKNSLTKKEPMILSVGRFFPHLHSKKQEVLIKAFISGLKQYPQLATYRLVLVGAIKNEDHNYLQYLSNLTKGIKNIEIVVNASYGQIQQYYQRAQIYWHAAGYKVNDKKNPEQVEHFGIAIVDAMNNYCVPIVYQAGGPKETVLHKKTGFFFTKPKELLNKTIELIKKPRLRQIMAIAAHERTVIKYGQKNFSKNLQIMLSK